MDLIHICFRETMISTTVFLTVLLLVQADSGYTEKRDHKYGNCYIGDAKIIAGFVYSMVIDISKETNDIFLSEMKSFQDIIEKGGYKTESPGKGGTFETFGSVSYCSVSCFYLKKALP